ncbi:MAG TPA: acyltransferase [Candidatus Dormibacteraeota bacterium]|nr:acyltransferase [Candidatus Dormibacteraeota bacterium]
MNEESARLRSVDGLRALAMIWIVSFHVLYFLNNVMDPHQAWAFFASTRFNLILQAPFGIDVLFVLSGFLIGGYVFRELKKSRLSMRTYFIRRAARLFPAYVAALALYAMVIPYNLPHVWANLLFVNNYVPFAQQAMGWTWTLGVDAHFYVLFPLAILLVRDSRWYLPLLIAALAGALAVRAFVVLHAGMTLPWLTSPVYDAAHFNRVFDVLYDKTQMRFGAIVCGLIAAYLYEYTSVRDALSRHAALALSLFLASIAVLAAYMAVPGYLPDSGARLGGGLSAFYLVTSDYAFAAAITCVLLLVLCEAPRSRMVAAWLSARMWYWPAELSYSAFLLNPLVILGAYVLVLHPSAMTLPKAIEYELLLIPLTYAAAALLYFSVEKPFRRMARRYTQVKPSAIAAERAGQ